MTPVTLAKPIWMNIGITDLVEYWWNIGGILVLDRAFIFLRKTLLMLINLHAVSAIIVDAPIQNVKIVFSCTDFMAHDAQDT